MSYSKNMKIQCLDNTGVWREGMIIDVKESKFRIHFENFTSKFDSNYSIEMLRKCVEERKIPRNTLHVPSLQLKNLIMGDSIKLNNDQNLETEGTLIQNDPFNCLVKIKEIGCSNVSYEKILSTSKDVNFKKHLSSSQIETKNTADRKQKKAKGKTLSASNSLNQIFNALDGINPEIQIHAEFDSIIDKCNKVEIEGKKEGKQNAKNKCDLKEFELEELRKLQLQFKEKLEKNSIEVSKQLTIINTTLTQGFTAINDTLNKLANSFIKLVDHHMKKNEQLSETCQMPISTNRDKNESNEAQTIQNLLSNESLHDIETRDSENIHLFTQVSFFKDLSSDFRKNDVVSNGPEISNPNDKIQFDFPSSSMPFAIQDSNDYNLPPTLSVAQADNFRPISQLQPPSSYLSPKIVSKNTIPLLINTTNINSPNALKTKTRILNETNINNLTPRIIESNHGMIEYLNQTEIKEILRKNKDPHLFAASILEKIFSKKELENCTVYGRGLLNKGSLDPHKIKYIQNLCEYLFNMNGLKDEKMWAHCVVNMNRKIRKITAHKNVNTP